LRFENRNSEKRRKVNNTGPPEQKSALRFSTYQRSSETNAREIRKTIREEMAAFDAGLGIIA